MIRAILFQAQMLPNYWVKALHVAVHLINLLPQNQKTQFRSF